MDIFYTKRTCRLTAIPDKKYTHRFGGKPNFKGMTPPGRDKPVTLLYDLDLKDPKHGLGDLFPNLTRLPLVFAIQHNCCEILYHVVSDKQIKIQKIKQENTDWNPNFPYENYPEYLPEHSISCKPFTRELRKSLNVLKGDLDPFNKHDRKIIKNELTFLKQFDFPFPVIGEETNLNQGLPEWKCPKPTPKCSHDYDFENKQVFAVIWEQPVPSFHLWEREVTGNNIGHVQILFSICNGCKIIHSCNMC